MDLLGPLHQVGRKENELNRKSFISFLFLICISVFHIQELCADYGEQFLIVVCDPKSKIFEIEPRIIWNEELEAIMPSLKAGNGIIKHEDRQLFNAGMIDSTIQYSCNISGNKLKVIVSDKWNRQLKLFENEKPVATFKIGYVWDFSGPEFKVRYIPNSGWSELCNTGNTSNSWQTLNRERKDTSCAKDTRAPN